MTGAGFPAEVDFRNTASLGLQRIHTLTEQLCRRVTLAVGAGCAIRIVFPHAGSKEQQA